MICNFLKKFKKVESSAQTKFNSFPLIKNDLHIESYAFNGQEGSKCYLVTHMPSEMFGIGRGRSTDKENLDMALGDLRKQINAYYPPR